MKSENKKKILFLSPYPFDKAPSQRLKYEQYFEVFRESNFQVETNSFMNEELWNIVYKNGFFIKKGILTLLAYIRRFLLLFSLHKYDIIYVHLWVTPFGLSFFEMMVSKLSKRLVYDIDDMIFLGHSSSANHFFQFLKGKRKMIYLMKKANHVITCTPKLDEFVRQYNSNTTDISSTVDTNKRYLPIQYKKKPKVVLGWSGSHSTSKYLYLLKDVFLELAQKYEYKLLVMGDKSFHIEGIDIEAIDWSEEIEMTTLSNFDIGLYPLPDEPWVYGKSGLKAIQYMALGIPTIATAIGANYRIIEHNVNGYLVNSKEDWLHCLSILIEDIQLRETIGTKGRKTIVDKYSISANQTKYLEVFNNITS